MYYNFSLLRQAVATDDLVLQALAGQSAMGLGYLSASMLLEEISIAYRYLSIC